MRTTILKIVTLLFLLLGFIRGQGQTITTTPGPITVCPGQVVVPVNVTNFNGVGAISLKLNYNNAILSYAGYQNYHAQLGGAPFVNSIGTQIVIAWASITPANIGNGVMVELLFNAVPGSSTLSWNTQTPGDCEFSDVDMNILPATFVNGSATIQQPPLINTQPINKSVLVGQSTSFTINAVATGITYLWQISTNGGASYTNLTNTSPYSGVTTATLNISTTTLAMNGYKYRCIIGGICPPTVTSEGATLTVILPVTSTLPTTSYCPGNIIVPVAVTNFTGVASFSLNFSFNPAVLTYDGYQGLNPALSVGNFVINQADGKVYISWAHTSAVTFGNGNIVEIKFVGATGTSSLLWQTQAAGSCEYVDINGNAITSVFVNGSQTVHALPAITSHPINKTIAKGQNTSFTVGSSGTGLVYRWQVSTDGGSIYNDLNNGGYYSNVTTATLNISGAQLAISGYHYRCKVSGTCTPIVYSSGAVLTVLPNIITACQSPSACPGEIIIPINVTDFIGVAAYSLTLTFNPSVLAFTCYQNLNTNLDAGNFWINASNGKVYFTWSRLTAATIANGAVLIELKFTGVTGSTALTWDTQTGGNCEYSDINGLVIYSTWSNGNATIHQIPSITTHPVNKTTFSGGSTSFSIATTGTGIGYQWQVSTNGGANFTNLNNGAPYTGVFTNTLVINPASQGMNGYLYRCYVQGTCTPYLYSNHALLTVTPPAIITTAGTINSATGVNIVVPVNVTNCNSVGSISLALSYDPSKLTYVGHQSPHAQLSTGLLAVNSTGNKVMLIWASTTPATIGNGQLIQFIFNANYRTTAPLTWDIQTPGNCEYSTPDGVIITSFYTNGSITITSLLPTATLKNITISNGQGQCFDATQTIYVAGDGSYFLVESGGSAELIAGQNIIFRDGTHVKEGGYMLARITTTSDYCNQLKPIIATHDEEEQFDRQQIADGTFFNIYPNPATNIVTLELNREASNQTISIEILSIVGECIFKSEFPEAKKYLLDLTGRQAGIYLIRVMKGNDVSYAKLILQ